MKGVSASCSWSTYGAAAALTIFGTASWLRKTSGKTKSSSKHQLRASFDPTMQVGALPPFGYWDPLGLMRDWSKDGEWKDEETFRQYRMAEIKHGRVAMMAMAGILMTTYVKFPGEFQDVPSGWAALSTPVGGGGFGILVLLAAFFELKYLKQDPSMAPGDLGDPVGFSRYEGFDAIDWGNKEINNGRLAMSGFAAGSLVEYYTGMLPAEQLDKLGEYLASPLCLVGVGFVLLGYMAANQEYGPKTKVKYDLAEIKSEPENPLSKLGIDEQPSEGMVSGAAGYKTWRDKSLEAGVQDGWNGATNVTRVMRRD